MSAKTTSFPERKRILLVEPNHEVLVRLMILIDEIAGDAYAMDWAASMRFGTSLLQRNDYDVCLVASQIGFQTGREFVRAAKELKPAIPVIMLEHPDTTALESDPVEEQLWDRLRMDQLSVQLLSNTLREAAALA
jgi:DNA-binding NtrC family response regulator